MKAEKFVPMHSKSYVQTHAFMFNFILKKILNWIIKREYVCLNIIMTTIQKINKELSNYKI